MQRQGQVTSWVQAQVGGRVVEGSRGPIDWIESPLQEGCVAAFSEGNEPVQRGLQTQARL